MCVHRRVLLLACNIRSLQFVYADVLYFQSIILSRLQVVFVEGELTPSLLLTILLSPLSLKRQSNK